MTELLPCPFCGRAPEFETDNLGLVRVACMSGKCSAYPHTAYCTSVDLAIRIWNTRHVETCSAIPKEPRWSECECSVCGGALESFNKFCPNCGAKVVAVDERTCKVVRYDAGGGAIWLTCSECGNIMPEHDNYCSSCCARVVER